MISRSESLAGRVALVTGATGGIGSAICRSLAAAGARVAVAYRHDAEAAEALARSLPGPDHAWFQADITESAQLDRLAAEITRRYGTVDVLVNCAGTTRFVPHADLDGLDDALIDDIFRTNWRGPFATLRALRPRLARDGGGVVINKSSISAMSGTGSNVAYCASKAALNTMTVSLARALAPAVRVLSICPGLVDTDFIAGLDPAWRQEQVARTPLGRLTRPDEIGEAVVAAATLTAATGTTIVIDGGRLLA
ncbi:MAG: SDR family oxidoreductase [Acidobacteria bacterium]|nr:SDR family oxidoreductase [Acidobacteriota bacterium]